MYSLSVSKATVAVWRDDRASSGERREGRRSSSGAAPRNRGLVEVFLGASSTRLLPGAAASPGGAALEVPSRSRRELVNAVRPVGRGRQNARVAGSTETSRRLPAPFTSDAPEEDEARARNFGPALDPRPDRARASGRVDLVAREVDGATDARRDGQLFDLELLSGASARSAGATFSSTVKSSAGPRSPGRSTTRPGSPARRDFPAALARRRPGREKTTARKRLRSHPPKCRHVFPYAEVKPFSYSQSLPQPVPRAPTRPFRHEVRNPNVSLILLRGAAAGDPAFERSSRSSGGPALSKFGGQASDTAVFVSVAARTSSRRALRGRPRGGGSSRACRAASCRSRARSRP